MQMLRLLFLTNQNCNNLKLRSYLKMSTEIPKVWENLREHINRLSTPGHIFVANAMLKLSCTLGLVKKSKSTPGLEEKTQNTALGRPAEPLVGCSNPACQFTKKDSSNHSMSKCAGCMSVQYCDRACQIKWDI